MSDAPLDEIGQCDVSSGENTEDDEVLEHLDGEDGVEDDIFAERQLKTRY